MDQSRWFVVQTQANKELFALCNLNRQGLLAWNPSIRKSVRSGRRIQMKSKPLFPGYIFVELDLNVARWRAIDSTFGVLRVVKIAGRPAPLPSGFVETLRALSDDEGHVAFREDLSAGDNVRIMGGAFDDMVGQVVRLPSDERVTLLISMIGRQVATTLPRAQVVKAA